MDGGRPVRETLLPYFRPSIDQADIDGVIDVLRSGWLTTGPKTAEFERQFAALIGARHAVAVSSCTAALHLALATLNIGDGDEVIVPTFTFAASAEVVTYFGATPVLVDVDRATGNLRPDDIEPAVNERTRAVIPVHFAGLPCDIEAIRQLAGASGIEIIEDAAHALPSGPGGALVGNDSRFACWSFYATKNVTTGEGGMLTTTDDAVAERARRLSLHGLSRDAWTRYSGAGSWYYEIEEPGYKYNMTDIAAALGLSQLARLPALHSARVRLAARYGEAFAGVEWLETPPAPTPSEHAWHLYVIRLNLERLSCSRDRFITALKAENIDTSVHFIPLHLHPYYRDRYGYWPSDLPSAFDLYRRVVSLPLYPEMSDADQDDAVAAVLKVGRACAR